MAVPVEPAPVKVEETVPAPVEEAKAEAPAVKPEPAKVDTEAVTKADIDKIAKENGIDAAIETLEKIKVVKLRGIAREYDGLGIAGREISKANKTVLIEEIRKYYEN